MQKYKKAGKETIRLPFPALCFIVILLPPLL